MVLFALQNFEGLYLTRPSVRRTHGLLSPCIEHANFYLTEKSALAKSPKKTKAEQARGELKPVKVGLITPDRLAEGVKKLMTHGK